MVIYDCLTGLALSDRANCCDLVMEGVTYDVGVGHEIVTAREPVT